jgi:hypothetical protein
MLAWTKEWDKLSTVRNFKFLDKNYFFSVNLAALPDKPLK